MAREPCSILEALACHPSNVVHMSMQFATAHLVWHGFCFLLPEARDEVVRTAKVWHESTFVHAHLKDYLTDFEGANEQRKCWHCSEEIRYLPAGYRLTEEQRHA